MRAPREKQGLFFNRFTTGNPFLGTKLLGCSTWRGSGALKGLIVKLFKDESLAETKASTSKYVYVRILHNISERQIDAESTVHDLHHDLHSCAKNMKGKGRKRSRTSDSNSNAGEHQSTDELLDFLKLVRDITSTFLASCMLIVPYPGFGYWSVSKKKHTHSLMYTRSCRSSVLALLVARSS